MPVKTLTPGTSTWSLPAGVKNVKLDTINKAEVTQYLPDTALNYRVATDSGATLVLADEKIVAVAGANGAGAQGGLTGQPAALPDLDGKFFAYVNDTSGTVHTDLAYEVGGNALFQLNGDGTVGLPFGYRMDPSTPDAVWPYLGFTTTYVRIVADQVIGTTGQFVLTSANNAVTWDTSTPRLPTGIYTWSALRAQITGIFRAAGFAGFQTEFNAATGIVELYAPYTIRFTNPTGSIWALLGFTQLTLTPPGFNAKAGQTIPLALLNAGLTAPTFPVDVPNLKLRYTTDTARDGDNVLRGTEDNASGDPVLRTWVYATQENTWTKGLVGAPGAFVFAGLSGAPQAMDTDSPFLFTPSGSAVFATVPKAPVALSTTGEFPLKLDNGATPFFTLETWAQFANDPQAENEVLMRGGTSLQVFRQGGTGYLGLTLGTQTWIGTTLLGPGTWNHLAVVAKRQNALTATLTLNAGPDPNTVTGVQKGMVCSGPGITGYVVVTDDGGNLSVTLPAGDSGDTGLFTFEAAGINLFVNGVLEALTANDGVVDWSQSLTDAHVTLGVEKNVLTLLDEELLADDTITDCAYNDNSVYLASTDVIRNGDVVTDLVGVQYLRLTAKYLYASFSTGDPAFGIQGYAIGTGGALTALTPQSTASLIKDLVLLNETYLYVVLAASVQPYDIGADGTLTALTAVTLPGGGGITMTLDPTGRYAYVLTATHIVPYTIGATGGLTQGTAVSVTGGTALVASETAVYFCTATRTKRYTIGTSGALGALVELVATNVSGAKIALDPASGNLYVAESGTTGIIHTYVETAATGAVIVGPSFSTGLTTAAMAGLATDGAYVYITVGTARRSLIRNANAGGKLSNLRISRETLYTGAFFPSVTPLPVDASTSFLMLTEGATVVNNAEDGFIEFYDLWTAADITLPNTLVFTPTPTTDETYLLSFVASTADLTLSINGTETTLTGTVYNQVLAQAFPLTITGTAETDGVTLSNIALKKIKTVGLGQGGQLTGYPTGGAGFTGGASGGPLQPQGSGGGTSYGLPGAQIGLYTGSAVPGATLTYLDSLTQVGDGNDWTSFNATDAVWQPALEPGTWQLLAYGQKGFLAGRNDNTALAFYDGLTWETLENTILFKGLAYSPDVNLFLGVAGNGGIWTTPAPKTTPWQLQFASGIALTGKISIAYGPLGFVVIAPNVNSVFVSNPAGTSWSIKTAALPGAIGYLSLAYGDQMFVTVTANGRVATSGDGGATWLSETGDLANDVGAAISGAPVGVVYGHQGFKIITATGNVYTKAKDPGTSLWSWTDDTITGLTTGITAIAYGGGKYIAISPAKYALGNTWAVFAVGINAAAIVFGNGQFLAGNGQTLGDFDQAFYHAELQPNGDLVITQETPEGLQTVTTVAAPADGPIRINGEVVIPAVLTGLTFEDINGLALFTTGTFPFQNEIYRKVQVELAGAGGGGGAASGGKGAAVLVRGTVLSEQIFISVGALGTGAGPAFPGGGATVLRTLAAEGGTGTGLVVAAGGGGAGPNGGGGNGAPDTGQEGQDGSGSPGTGADVTGPGQLLVTDADVGAPGQPASGGGGGGGGGLRSGGDATTGGGGGAGSSGILGDLVSLSLSFNTAPVWQTGAIRFTVLPKLQLDSARTDATILYLRQGDLPLGYAFSRTLTYKVQMNTATDEVLITGRTAELETLSTFTFFTVGTPYQTVVIKDANGESYIYGTQPPICFQTGTGILTPTGYVPVENLQENALVCTARGAIVPVVKHVTFQSNSAACPLFCLKAHRLGPGLPLNDLYLSHNHAFKFNGRWRHMKCTPATHEVVQAEIIYHHLYLPDYFRDTLLAEGVEVESAFQETRYERMGWLCEEEECVPLKCERTTLN